MITKKPRNTILILLAALSAITYSILMMNTIDGQSLYTTIFVLLIVIIIISIK